MKVRKQVSKYGRSHNEKLKNKVRARYYPPEMLPYALCAACLDVVLSESKEAKKIYDEVVECYNLPGCQEIGENYTLECPNMKKLSE